MTQSLKQRVAELRQQIEQHDYSYYVLDNPEIPDADFDRAVAVIAEAGYDTSRLQRVPQKW